MSTEIISIPIQSALFPGIKIIYLWKQKKGNNCLNLRYLQSIRSDGVIEENVKLYMQCFLKAEIYLHRKSPIKFQNLMPFSDRNLAETMHYHILKVFQKNSCIQHTALALFFFHPISGTLYRMTIGRSLG